MKIARTSIIAVVVLATAAVPHGLVEGQASIADRVGRIMDREEFKRTHFGVLFYSLDKGKAVFAHNAEKHFTPGSTTKLVSAGSLLRLLGADHRFETRIYRTGQVSSGGSLDGDLVLVASGDPNLSGRIEPDGTLAFEDMDHLYGGNPVPGDPLTVIRDLARQVAAKGIREVSGGVRVDVSLFPEGARELGSGSVISPIAVNDNLVDLTVGPGPTVGAPVGLSRRPVTSYVRFVNQATTSPAGAAPSISFTSDEGLDDGSRVVTIGGTLPLDSEPGPLAYRVPVPSRYAEVLLTEALVEAGVHIRMRAADGAADFARLRAFYRDERVVAEHRSPPVSEAVKVNLKVSQNLHASMIPHLLAATRAPGDAERTGFDEIHDFLEAAGLDVAGAHMGDGAGGLAHFAPAFMVAYLEYMSRQDDFEHFRRALPILGVDGTLFDIQTQSPAAGHVFAKTGTYVDPDPLNRGLFLTAKGLAGYIDRADGERLAFAIYINNVPLSEPGDITRIVGQAIGEIAAVGYDGTY